MIRTNIFNDTEAHRIAQKKGIYSVLEYVKDVSVTESTAINAFFSAKMNVRKRQLVANIADGGVVVQAGAMQLMLGDLTAATNVKGAGDLFKKAIGSKVTGESAIKPRYTGTGTLVLEPTYKHIILEDLAEWNGKMVIEDGLFLACDDTVNLSVVARNSLSSAALGGEGLFNTALSGSGVVALESPVPMEELIEVEVDNDVVKIDGNMAIAWSDTLKFTVEKTTKSLVGSAASGEGFVNTYRGTGKILIAPVG
ncbi:AIM24 family protein [Eubacterium xylanophilum]|uniref:AIM24 family protein n=1 Tax=Eubacterium xylanophilum TaxID=39497 RepID=UPI00047DEC91|nr:AIM24 family protein [Eubacterium xylanophilum]